MTFLPRTNWIFSLALVAPLLLGCSRSVAYTPALLADARDEAILGVLAERWLGGASGYEYFELSEWQSGKSGPRTGEDFFGANPTEDFPGISPALLRRWETAWASTGEPKKALAPRDARLRFLDSEALAQLDIQFDPDDYEDRAEVFEAIFESFNIDGWWERYRARFPDSAGSVSTSEVVYDCASGEALVYVGFGCGGLCGEGFLAWLRWEGGDWRLVNHVLLWVS